MPHERVTQREHQDGAEINTDEIEPGRCGVADRTKEGPRCAIDCERKRVDRRARSGTAGFTSFAITDAGDDKEQQQIAKCGEDDAPIVHVLAPDSAVLCAEAENTM